MRGGDGVTRDRVGGDLPVGVGALTAARHHESRLAPLAQEPEHLVRLRVRLTVRVRVTARVRVTVRVRVRVGSGMAFQP